jgi:hypothetical protein
MNQLKKSNFKFDNASATKFLLKELESKKGPNSIIGNLSKPNEKAYFSNIIDAVERKSNLLKKITVTERDKTDGLSTYIGKWVQVKFHFLNLKGVFQPSFLGYWDNENGALKGRNNSTEDKKIYVQKFISALEILLPELFTNNIR